MCEYAAVYGGFPASTMKWPLFLAALKRIARFDARERLRLFDSVYAAIGAALSGEGGEEIRGDLFAGAYPVKADWSPVRLIPNLAQEAS